MGMPDNRRNALQAVDAARRLARRAAMEIAVQNGSQIVSSPAFPGALAQSRDVEPIAGVWAAHELELAARQVARRYVRDAREAGPAGMTSA